MPRRAVLFANARSGRARRWFAPICEEAERRGIALTAIQRDLTPGAIRKTLHQAEQDGISTILAAGGDGTVGTIAGFLVHTDFVLGVIPAGSSNDFARSLLIPQAPDGAMEVVAGGLEARVDVGEANGKVFVHAAVVGLNSVFAEEAQRLRRCLGRASYPVACILVYPRRSKFTFNLKTPTDTLEISAIEIAFVNAPIAGGALELEADADLENRRLAVVIVEDLKLGPLLSALPRILRRRIYNLPGVETLQVSRAELVTEPVSRVTVDGEIDGQTPASFRVVPGALRVFAPQSFVSRERTL